MDTKDEHEELLSVMNDFMIEASPVNKVLGIRFTSADSNVPRLEFEMKENLVGWIYAPMLHGGIIATVLDVVGSAAVYLDITAKMKSGSAGERMEKYKERHKLNTIDLRIDYLRPGTGKVFIASSTILRTGKKVGVARMELHNEEQHLIAVGTGTYIVGK